MAQVQHVSSVYLHVSTFSRFVAGCSSQVTALKLVPRSTRTNFNLVFVIFVHVRTNGVWSSRCKSMSCILCFFNFQAFMKGSLKFLVNQVASRDHEYWNKTRKCTCRKLIKFSMASNSLGDIANNFLLLDLSSLRFHRCHKEEMIYLMKFLMCSWNLFSKITSRIEGRSFLIFFIPQQKR